MYAWVLVTQIRMLGREKSIIARWLRPLLEEGKFKFEFGFGAAKNCG